MFWCLVRLSTGALSGGLVICNGVFSITSIVNGLLFPNSSLKWRVFRFVFVNGMFSW